jgi:phytoene desaturase
MQRAVVIGAGVGGMATAIRLAHQGFSVSIYEASAQCGGKLSQKQLGQYRFDLGPSLFTLPELVRELFELCGEDFDAHFPLEKLDPVAHYFWEDGVVLKANSNPELWVDQIATHLGESKDRVQHYFDQAGWIYETTRPVFLESSLRRLPWRTWKFWKALFSIPLLPVMGTLHSRNQRYFKNPKTVQMMNRYATYNGSNPYQTPAMMSMIPHLEHGIGAYLPKEGMHQITRALENLMRKMGVEIHLQSKVEQILYQGKEVKGVQVNGEALVSDIVVSNVDAYFTYHQLLPQFPKPEKILKQERSSSAIIFYWGMSREFPNLDVHNLFFANDYEKEFEGIFQKAKLSEDVTVYVNITSKKVASDAPQGCENWFVMINAPRYQGGDETEVVAIAKKAILKKLNSILKMDVEQFIEVEDILTPRLIQERTSSYAGSLYGTASNNAFAAFRRHDNFISGLKGLYFVGGSVHPGGGIPLCLYSAKIVAQCTTQFTQQ